MKFNSLFSLIFLFTICAEIAIGRVVDNRLMIMGLNISLIISLTYFFSSIIVLSSIRDIHLNKSKFILYSFFAIVVLIHPILWSIYGINSLPISIYGHSYQDGIIHTTEYSFLKTAEYGVLKFLNFILITIPICIIVVEKFAYREVRNIYLILLLLVFLLLFFAIFGVFETPREDGRISILGGGPIIFGRWMGYGVLTLFFLPINKNFFIKLFFIILFFIFCFASGSRGPVLALILTFLLYFFLNFRKIFLKIILSFSVICSLLLFTNLPKMIFSFGKIERVFLNIYGSSQSTQTRFELVDRSIELMVKYPLGVGIGNWQFKANEHNTSFLIPHKYPHNLFLELINEHGFIVAFLFIFLLIYSFHLGYIKMYRYSSDKSSIYDFLFYLSVYLFFNVMLSGSLNDSRLLLVTLCCILIHKPLLSIYER